MPKICRSNVLAWKPFLWYGQWFHLSDSDWSQLQSCVFWAFSSTVFKVTACSYCFSCPVLYKLNTTHPWLLIDSRWPEPQAQQMIWASSFLLMLYTHSVDYELMLRYISGYYEYMSRHAYIIQARARPHPLASWFSAAGSLCIFWHVDKRRLDILRTCHQKKPYTSRKNFAWRDWRA
jgi:hypothetical protein